MKTKRTLQIIRLAFAVLIIAALTVLKNANNPDSGNQTAKITQEAGF
jgi:hypothetical protein